MGPTTSTPAPMGLTTPIGWSKSTGLGSTGVPMTTGSGTIEGFSTTMTCSGIAEGPSTMMTGSGTISGCSTTITGSGTIAGWGVMTGAGATEAPWNKNEIYLHSMHNVIADLIS